RTNRSLYSVNSRLKEARSMGMPFRFIVFYLKVMPFCAFRLFLPRSRLPAFGQAGEANKNIPVFISRQT
ncbi:hypothetical protein, partial [Bacteroides heparinolyticus]|uniref:hypothetical protein n=1 Tax=Prevotella heparinolytica TaxID=28113 RepID=UPI0035A0E90C